jgi:hypothetical protein
LKAIFWTRHEIGRVEESDYRETNLAHALQAGARAHGDDVEVRVAPGAYPKDVVVEQCDLVVLAGVKSRFWFKAYAEAGIPWLYFDKGYIRERAPDQWLSFWRMSVNSHHPINYLAAAKHTSSRANAVGFRFSSWREDAGGPIVVDGGSEKNFKFNGIIPEEATIRDVDVVCTRLVSRIKQITNRRVIYRPKPSSPDRRPIAGTEWARERAGVNKKDVFHDLERASAVVTVNGAICYDAHRIGVPSIVLGSGPARPISSIALEELEQPRLADSEERRQWINNLAWCQFEPHEIRAGLAWATALKMLEVTPVKTPAEACPCLPL